MSLPKSLLVAVLWVRLEFSESQNGWGWQAPQKIIQSTLPGQAGSLRAGRPVLCPSGFWVSPSMESPQPLWTTCAGVWPPSQLQTSFSCAPIMAALGNRVPMWSKVGCCTRRADKIRAELLFRLAPVAGLCSLLAARVATGSCLIYQPWARKPQTMAGNILKDIFVTPEETS